jgi:hypothetical protein
MYFMRVRVSFVLYINILYIKSKRIKLKLKFKIYIWMSLYVSKILTICPLVISDGGRAIISQSPLHAPKPHPLT